LVEGDETVIVALEPGAAYTLGMSSDAIATIADTPVVTVTATDQDASEVGPDPGTFVVTRTGSTAAALTVNFTRTGTAVNGTDYTAIGTSVQIPAGEPSASITIAPLPDAIEESDET